MERKAGASFVHVDDGGAAALETAIENIAGAAVTLAVQLAAAREAVARREPVAVAHSLIDVVEAMALLEDATPDDIADLRGRARAAMEEVGPGWRARERAR